ncbi:nuclear transport factor 2 family protein [Segetibacter sp. 3557_3]|uniref:YybH family protein n=1 Tax=Segetibacter sp. 3557_3 TaxID=2547429 RepID=UPI001058A3E4|nr:nuclear transport factor 2 family protein [Segetibacter sp. 3557_3]TDH27396.1 nuclear transport factor 2 family protein [Segetibacter sp. 3557_3]
MKTFLIVVAIVVMHASAQAQADQQAIRSLMQMQEKAWNKGDINGFMEGYLKSDSMLFVGSKGPTYGWRTTLEHYKKSYPDTATMGKLKFDILEVKPLAGPYYFVLGKWQLTRTIGNVGGYYTLLFQKINNRFYIIADHSS